MSAVREMKRRVNLTQKTIVNLQRTLTPHVALVECSNGFVSRDLFGCLDVLAVVPQSGVTIGIQVTSRAHMAERRRKVQRSEHIAGVLQAGWSVWIEGWDQVGGGWRLHRQVFRIIDKKPTWITMTDSEVI